MKIIMVCPKCNEGTITKIKFKRNGKQAHLCNLCEALWLEGENINSNSSHTLKSYSQSEDIEYAIDELEEKDQDHQPAGNKYIR